MPLDGISPTRRTPGTLRQFFFAAGPGSAAGIHEALIYANKTSAGSETTNTIGDAVRDRSDAKARFGARSEAFHMWRLFNAANKNSSVRVCCVPQGTGTLARTVTFAGGAATATTTCLVEYQGESVEFYVPTGMTAVQMASAMVDAFNSASSGEWMGTAAIGGVGSEHIVTVTVSQLGARLAPLVNISLRVTFRKDVTSTITLGAAATPGTDDDFTTAYTQATAGAYFYQVNPKTGTTGPTPTDNGIGEGIAYLRDQLSPTGGKEQVMFFGLTGTQAQATTVVTDADVNEVTAFFFRAENSDWTAGMIAAHWGGIASNQLETDPAANINGWRAATGRVVLGPPDPHDKTDRPTAQEIEDDLRNGISPLAFDSHGNVYLVRFETSYTEISAGVKDYRASEGHTPFAIFAAWAAFSARWEAEKQGRIADDPPQGAKPFAKTSTPSQLRAIAHSIIDEYTSNRPRDNGTGPILSPSPADVLAMRNSIDVDKVAGGFTVGVDWLAVEHWIKTEVSVRQVNVAYAWNISIEPRERWWTWGEE